MVITHAVLHFIYTLNICDICAHEISPILCELQVGNMGSGNSWNLVPAALPREIQDAGDRILSHHRHPSLPGSHGHGECSLYFR